MEVRRGVARVVGRCNEAFDSLSIGPKLRSYGFRLEYASDSIGKGLISGPQSHATLNARQEDASYVDLEPDVDIRACLFPIRHSPGIELNSVSSLSAHAAMQQ